MRSLNEQDEFLECGRFGGKRTPIALLTKIGLFFIGGGCTCFSAIVFLNIDSDPISAAVSVPVTGSILCVCLGITLCICSLVVNRTH
jgi:hypothetical protein